jgi:hypothetical protein
MSHFVRIMTVLREREILKDALRDLGLAFEEGEGLEVRGDARRTETAEVVVRTTGGFDVGFRPSGEEYEIVADWYRVERSSSLRRKDFVEAVTRRYAYRVVLAEARAQNLVVEEETLEDGNIVIVLSERG